MGSGLPISEPVWSVDGHRLELLELQAKVLFVDDEPLKVVSTAVYEEAFPVGGKRIALHSRWDEAWKVTFIELFVDGELLPPAHEFAPRVLAAGRPCEGHAERTAVALCAGCRRSCCGECLSADGTRCPACLRAAQQAAPFVVNQPRPPLNLPLFALALGLGAAVAEVLTALGHASEEQSIVLIVMSIAVGMLLRNPYEELTFGFIVSAGSTEGARRRRTWVRWLPLFIAASLVGGTAGYEELIPHAHRPPAASRPMHR